VLFVCVVNSAQDLNRAVGELTMSNVITNRYTTAQRLLACESELADLRKLVQSIQLKEGLQGIRVQLAPRQRRSAGSSRKDGKDSNVVDLAVLTVSR